MFSPIHPRYQTLKTHRVDEHARPRRSADAPITLSTIYERIDEDLAER